jgi:hypothetical protein
MYIRIMATRRKILTTLTIACFLLSIYQLYHTPEAVGWAGAALAHLIVFVSMKTERIPDFDSDFLNILNVSLGIVATLVSAGQYFILEIKDPFFGINGPFAMVISASALAIWAIRPRKKA